MLLDLLAWRLCGACLPACQCACVRACVPEQPFIHSRTYNPSAHHHQVTPEDLHGIRAEKYIPDLLRDVFGGVMILFGHTGNHSFDTCVRACVRACARALHARTCACLLVC